MDSAVSDKMVSITLRLPGDLHRALQSLAAFERRSLNAEIIHLLLQHTETPK